MDSQTKELKCPACGGPAKCYHQDVGGVEYYDEYVLYCPKCGRIERSTIYGGSPMSDNWGTNCPYCGVDCYSHPGTPPELWGYSFRYLPLFKFNLAGKSFCIAIRDGKVELEAEYSFPFIPPMDLDIPIPYNLTSISTTWETYDEVGLDFSMISSTDKTAEIRIRINERKGYWYYGSLDDQIPSVVTTEKKLIVLKGEKKSFSCRLQ